VVSLVLAADNRHRQGFLANLRVRLSVVKELINNKWGSHITSKARLALAVDEAEGGEGGRGGKLWRYCACNDNVLFVIVIIIF
jgi:hypothetical protein